MLSKRISYWCVPWAYGSGTDAYPEQHMHQFLTRMLSISIKNSKFEKSLQNMLSNEHACKELMRALIVRVRNWCARSACASEIKWCLAPPKIKVTSFYFSPKVTYLERLSWKSKRTKISYSYLFINPIKFHTWEWKPLKWFWFSIACLAEKHSLTRGTQLTAWVLHTRVLCRPCVTG